jgi:Transposase DDE domain group 1
MRGAHVRFGGAGRGDGPSETTTPRPGPIPTDLADTDIAYLEALQRGRGRAEKLICNAKDTGLTNLPSGDFAINAAWLITALIAYDLLAWARLVALDGELARAEPKRLRYCLLHAAALVARSGRRTRLRIAAGWPWATELITAFERVRSLQLTT